MEKNIIIRKASENDVPVIVRLLSDDILGKTPENTGNTIAHSYYDAFFAIDNDINQKLVVATINEKVIGTLQLTFINNMSFQGAKRALIEGVHVDKDLRGNGIGQFLMEWAINEAKQNGCRFAQLTSNKARSDAHRFYKKLGFTPSHEGFKLDFQNI